MFPGHVLRNYTGRERRFRVHIIDQKTLEGTTHCGWEKIPVALGLGMGFAFSERLWFNLDWVEIDDDLEGRALHGE